MKALIAFTLVVMSASISSAEESDVRRVGPRIGFVLPLTGDYSSLGNGIRDGALLAQSDSSIVDSHVELFFEDNRGELTDSAVAASKLISENRVDALISIISGVGKVLKAQATNVRILNIGICSDTDVADGQYSFINYLTAEQGVEAYLKYFEKAHGKGGPVGVYVMEEAGFVRILNEFERRAPGRASISFIERFDRSTTDFRSLVTRNRTHQPIPIMVLGLSPQIELLAHQAKILARTSRLTSIESFGLANDKSELNGGWYVDSAEPTGSFQTRFRAKYNREVTPGVGHAYDSVRMIVDSFANASGNREAAIQNFRQLSNYRGVIGSLSVRADGIIWSEPSIKQILHGKPETVSTERHSPP